MPLNFKLLLKGNPALYLGPYYYSKPVLDAPTDPDDPEWKLLDVPTVSFPIFSFPPRAVGDGGAAVGVQSRRVLRHCIVIMGCCCWRRCRRHSMSLGTAQFTVTTALVREKKKSRRETERERERVERPGGNRTTPLKADHCQPENKRLASLIASQREREVPLQNAKSAHRADLRSL